MYLSSISSSTNAYSLTNSTGTSDLDSTPSYLDIGYKNGELESTTSGINASNGSLVDEEQLLLENLGPRRRELGEVIVFTCVYAIILITGVVGNICTCFVIAKNKHMHTATNYYLFSLAVSDVLTLILGKCLLNFVFTLYFRIRRHH